MSKKNTPKKEASIYNLTTPTMPNLITAQAMQSALKVSRARLHQLRAYLKDGDYMKAGNQILYYASALTKLQKRQKLNSKFKNKVK